MSTTDASFASYLPILVVDTNGSAAQQLAEQLRHSGFQTDVATSYSAAQTAIRARHYGSLVVVADPRVAADLDCLAALRKKVPRTWIVAISSTAHPQVEQVFFRRGIDSILVAPFSVQDLTSRLLAFSHRSRPA